MRVQYLCISVQDPLLRMIGFQDADGNLLAEASRSELRRIALVVGEKLLKATCNLIRPTAGQRFLVGKAVVTEWHAIFVHEVVIFVNKTRRNWLMLVTHVM